MNSISLPSENNEQNNLKKNKQMIKINNDLSSKQKAEVFLNHIKQGKKYDKKTTEQIIVSQIQKISNKAYELSVLNTQQQNKCKEELNQIQENIKGQEQIGRKYFLKIQKFIQQIQNDYLFKFQKIHKERLNSQIQLTRLMDTHIDNISKKSKGIIKFIGREVSDLQQSIFVTQIQTEFIKLKLQTKQYFQKLAKDEKTLKQKINKKIRQFKKLMLQFKLENEIDTLFDELLKVEREVTQKIRILKSDRVNVENVAIDCLQKMLSMLN